MSNMKRVLVTVPNNEFSAWYRSQTAVAAVIRKGYELWAPCGLGRFHVRKINKARPWESHTVLRCESGWQPDFKNLPKQFVVELPEKFVRDGVPTYTGPIKGETPAVTPTPTPTPTPVDLPALRAEFFESYQKARQGYEMLNKNAWEVYIWDIAEYANPKITKPCPNLLHDEVLAVHKAQGRMMDIARQYFKLTGTNLVLELKDKRDE
jgi:hypothetical protein